MNQKLKESIWRYLSGIILVIYAILSWYYISKDDCACAIIYTTVAAIILLPTILFIDGYFSARNLSKKLCTLKHSGESPQFTKELDESIKYEKVRLINCSIALKLIRFMKEKELDPNSQEALDHISVELCWPLDKVKKCLRGSNTMTLTLVDIVDVENLLGCTIIREVKEI